MSANIRLIPRAAYLSLLPLTQEIYPKMPAEILTSRLEKMFEYENYLCWGYYENDILLGVCGGWFMERLYCGKQLEIDNFIVSEKHRSQGIGARLLTHIEAYAKENDCFTIELNSYVHAGQSHKFYFKNGYTVLGFHFEKKLF